MFTSLAVIRSWSPTRPVHTPRVTRLTWKHTHTHINTQLNSAEHKLNFTSKRRHTVMREVLDLEKHDGIAGSVQNVPPLDRLNVTQQRIVGHLHPSCQDLCEETMMETRHE